MQLIDNLNWRYATKQFDASKKVSDADLAEIKEAIRLAASSYGLQLYKVIEVKNTELREKLKPASWGQSQITDASNLLVFCSYAEVKDDHIDDYLKLKSSVHGVELDAIQGYGDFIKGKMKELSTEQQQVWTTKQTYIALANALVACAELKIDSTPMEGFEAGAYEEILGLDKLGLKAAVVLAIGYRSEADATQHGAKLRKSNEDLFLEL